MVIPTGGDDHHEPRHGHISNSFSSPSIYITNFSNITSYSTIMRPMRPHWWRRGYARGSAGHAPLCHQCWRCPAGVSTCLLTCSPTNRESTWQPCRLPRWLTRTQLNCGDSRVSTFVMFKEIKLLCDVWTGVPTRKDLLTPDSAFGSGSIPHQEPTEPH